MLKFLSNTIEDEDAIYFKVNSYNSLSFILDYSSFITQCQQLNTSHDDQTKEELNKVLSRVLPFPTTDNFFDTSMNIVKTYNRSFKRLSKPEAEKAIDYFLSLQRNEGDHLDFELSLERINQLGTLIIYSFQKMERFKIKSAQQFKESLKAVSISQIDVIADYHKYCKAISKQTAEILLDRINFWKTNRKNYLLPPEFLFMLKFFGKYCFIKFNLGKVTQQQFYYILIILVNLELVFEQLQGMHVGLSAREYLKEIYEIHHDMIIKREKEFGRFLKKYNFADLTFEHGWAFEDNYIINRKSEISIEGYYEFEGNTSAKDILLSLNSFECISPKEGNNNTINFNNNINYSNTYTEGSGSKKKNNSLQLITKFLPSLEVLIIISAYLPQYQKITSLSLFFCDNYLREIKVLLRNSLNIQLSSETKGSHGSHLHFLDFLLVRTYALSNSCISNLNELNIELNSIDFCSFRKVLSLISQAEKLKILRLSLFASQEVYLSAGLQRLVREIEEQNSKKADEKEKEKENDMMILRKLLPLFNENMGLCFYLLRERKEMNEICIYGDSPTIIALNDSYSLTILKFVFNILTMLSVDNAQLTTVKLLFPSIIADSRTFPGIIDFINDISLIKNNEKLLHFHLQMKFFQISNIYKLITMNLLSLTLGDLDVYSFESFVKVYSSQKFSESSNLEKITIGLLSMVVDFDEVKESLNNFFYCKQRRLRRITLYSNLKITDRNELEKMINYNWVKEYKIELHKESIQFEEGYMFLIKNDNVIDASIFERHKKIKDSEERFSIIKNINKFLFKSERIQIEKQPRKL